MQPCTTRPANAEDIPAIFDILEAAFRLENKPDRARTMRNLAENDWRNFLVLEDAAGIQAVAHVRPDLLQVGGTVVRKGDLGHVGVRPECQGRGLGTVLLEAAVRWMRENGFHLSRLGGLMRFYRRFGYEPFIRRYIAIPVEPMDALMKGRTWAEIRTLAPELEARVRPYDPRRDHAGRHELLGRFYDGRPGAGVRPDTPGPPPAAGPNPEGLEFVYVHNDALRGYIRGSVRPPEAHAAPRPCIDEFAADFEFPEAVEALFKRFIRAAARYAPTEIAARLPYDERLYAALVRADIAFHLREMHQAADGNMIQVLDLRATLAAIAPELRRRFEAAGCIPWEGVIRFELPGQAAGLRISADGVAPANGGESAAATIAASQAEFVQWLFGIAGFGEFPAAAALPGPLRLVLDLLFPRLPCASGPWG